MFGDATDLGAEEICLRILVTVPVGRHSDGYPTIYRGGDAEEAQLE